MKDQLDILYMSDFVVADQRTLNTLCLFYDRLFLHDYFGVYCAVSNKAAYDDMLHDDPRLVDFTWAVARGLDRETLNVLRAIHTNPLEALVLKGVAQGLGLETGRFSPTFLIRYAVSYSNFIRSVAPLIHGGALAMCHTSWNPWSPAGRGAGSARLDLRCTDEESCSSLSQARENNRQACLFEQEYHKLPLISDINTDPLPWDRDKDLISAALAFAAIPARVPTIGDVPADVILEAREHLKDSLIPFRNSLLQAAWDVGQAARNSSRGEVVSLSQLYYGSRIEPAVKEIDRQVREKETKLRQKLLERGIDQAVLITKALDPTDPLSKWELLGSAVKGLLDIEDSREDKAKIRSPYEFLVKLPALLKVR